TCRRLYQTIETRRGLRSHDPGCHPNDPRIRQKSPPHLLFRWIGIDPESLPGLDQGLQTPGHEFPPAICELMCGSLDRSKRAKRKLKACAIVSRNEVKHCDAHSQS